jgi:tetratricopeptide (TPR) repeat protein
VDPTVIHEPAAGIREPYGPEQPARTMANDQIVVGDIPAQRPGFQPRPALLARLNQARQGPSVMMLTGAWGVGKTQLAAAYARARLAGGWRLIVWINARTSQSLLAGLAEAAETAAPSDGGSRQGAPDPGQAFRRWLEADGSRCLLVFDDAEDLGLLQPFVPAVGAARVLITMAREPMAELGTRIPVDVFRAEEALALLDGRTGMADEAGASAVAAELGHLPLALDQAAAVIAKQHLGYAAYLEKLRALPVADYLVRKEDEKEQPYPPAVAGAVLLSLEAARAADPVGVCTGVMEVMTMLAPAAVRCDLLRVAGQAGILLGGGRRVAASMVDQALERLNERSLLSFSLDRRAVSVHCLVARVVREGLVRQGHLARACEVAASALEMSAEALPKPLDHAAVREMAGQVTALTDNARAGVDDASEGLATMLTRLRFLALYYLIEVGDSGPQAIALGEPLMEDLERLLGPDHPDSLNVRTSLAAAYGAAGRASEAIPLLEQTLVVRVRLLGPDHPDTLIAQNNLAAAYQAAGRADEAILMFRMTLAAREQLLGADHPDTLRSQNRLAAAYKAAGQASEAIPLVEKILAARERALGASHPKTLSSRNNLAAAYQAAGRAAEAVPMLEQTLAACERLLGAADPRTKAVRHNLLLARQEAEPGKNAGLVDQVGGDFQDDGP